MYTRDQSAVPRSLSLNIVHVLFALGYLLIRINAEMCWNSTSRPSNVGHYENKLYREECFEAKGHSLICAAGLHGYGNGNGSDRLQQLELRYWPTEGFNPEVILRLFPEIRFFNLTNSNVTHFTTQFPESHSLKHVTISHTAMSTLNETTFLQLHSLRTLDLRFNNFSYIPEKVFANLLPDSEVFLSGNLWNCSTDLEWIIESPHVKDKSILTCHGQKYKSKPLLQIITLIQKFQQQCPATPQYNCSCDISYTAWSDDCTILPVTIVNCSNRGLLELPKIPTETKILIANGNKISNLEPIATDPLYRGVWDIYLDNNEITSIVQLEGADWLENFRVLSLRGNNLTKVPTFVLLHALIKNNHAAQLHLGNNPWRCDCLVTPKFQDFLLHYHQIVVDAADIKCAENKNDENSRLQIRFLQRSAICGSHTIQPLDILNCCLGALIIFMLVKLAYDYYYYKKSGKVPWFVTKMP